MKNLIKPTNTIINLFFDAWNSTSNEDKQKRAVNDIMSVLEIEPKYPKYFDDIYSIVKRSGNDDAKIKEVFKKCGNKKEDDVLYKVLILDKLYSTQIVDPISIARGILNIKDIDNRLKIVDESLVEEIAKCGNQRHEYSFATKYCSWSNEGYVIYDNIIGHLLLSYNKCYNFYKGDFYLDSKNKKRCSLSRYDDFLRVYRKFTRTYELDTSDGSYKKIDIFLWLYGKILNKEKESLKK